MKKVLIVSGLSLLVSLSAMGHTLQSQDGINVTHNHFGVCQNSYTCPQSDGLVESLTGFLSSDRTHSSTYEYNCHGRTFDNRGSWVNHSDPWVFGYGNQSVQTPSIGDVVVWTKSGSGSTSSKITTHTATIIGSWNGNNTLVSSKYGQGGEYHHALVNTMNVYGNYSMIIRMNTANVYSMTESEIEQEAKSRDYYVDSLIEIKELEQKGNTLTLQEKFTQLPKINKLTLNKNNVFTKEKDIKFLLFDLVKDRSVMLSLFSLPDFTEDLVTNIESGKSLVKIAENNPELAQEIGDNLKEIIMSRSHDTVRGIAVYYLSEIEKVSGLSWNIGDLFPKVLEKPDEMLYFDYYLNKAQQ